MPDPPPDDAHRVSLLRRPGCWVTFAAVIPLLIGAAWVAEDWAGRRFLTQTKERLAAGGGQFAPEMHLPAPVPEEENFCATPLLAAIGDQKSPRSPDREIISRSFRWFYREHLIESKSGRRYESIIGSLFGPGHLEPTGWAAGYEVLARHESGIFTDPAPVDPAQTLSETLEHQAGPLFADLESALERPYAQWLPRTPITAKNKRLRQRCIEAYQLANLLYVRLHLALDRRAPDRAGKTWRIIWKLADATSRDGSFYAVVMGGSIRRITFDALWSAAAMRAFPASQWREISGSTARPEGIALLRAAWLAEDNRLQSFRDELRDNPSAALRHWLIPAAMPPPDFTDKLGNIMSLLPQGWYDFNEAHYLSLGWQLIQAADEPSSGQLTTGGFWKAAGLAESSALGHLVLAKMYLPHLREYIVAILQSDILARFATLAGALESYYLEHQDYPDSLNALTPAYLTTVPADLDGASLRYAREPRNGRYRLWSVGINGVDDGGTRSSATHPNAWGLNDDDWIWGYP